MTTRRETRPEVTQSVFYFFLLLTPVVFFFISISLLCVLCLFTCVYTDGRRIGRGLIQSKLAVFKVFTGKNALKYLPFCDLNLCVSFCFGHPVAWWSIKHATDNYFVVVLTFQSFFFVDIFIVIFCCCLVCEQRRNSRGQQQQQVPLIFLSFHSFWTFRRLEKKSRKVGGIACLGEIVDVPA